MKELFRLSNVEYYYEDKRVLHIEDLILEENQIIGFLGPNGSGKTTLFNLLSFVNRANKGDIFYKGIKSDKLTQKNIYEVVMLPQNPYLLKRSVYENIIFGLKLRNDLLNVDKRVQEALSYVGLDNSFLQRKWSQLSGGEAQRVALCSRLILKPKVLILDEPTTGVDINSAQLIKEAIFLARQKWNTTILISSHDHNWLNHVSDRKIGLFQGEFVEHGGMNLLFAPWEKNNNGDLVKIFSDRQKLVFKNSKQKKRDSVVMLNPNSIKIYSKDEKIEQENLIRGIINSMQQDQNDNKAMLVDVVIGVVNIKVKLTLEEIVDKRFLPTNEVYVKIDTTNVCWI